MDINRFDYLYMIVESDRLYFEKCRDQMRVAHVAGAEIELQSAIQSRMLGAERVYQADLSELNEEAKTR